MPRRPTLSLPLLNFAPAGTEGLAAAVLTRAAVADELGIDRVVVVDHVVMGDNIDAYDGGRFPTGPDGLWLDPLTVLTAVAARTTRVRLATGILIAPLRRAPELAKSTATLDLISGGRLELGVGVGWQREEYDASGVPFERRGDELDRMLAACRALWRGEATTALGSGGSRSPDGAGQPGDPGEPVWCEPRPVQPGGVPLWISGRLHGRTLRRIVTYGDGWIPWGEHRDDVVPGIARVHDALTAGGRDPDGFGVRDTLPIAVDAQGRVDGERTVAPVPGRVEAGVTDFSVAARLPGDRAALIDLLAPVVNAFARATGRTP
jgi:probable F420-dependent oxidoreductase